MFTLILALHSVFRWLTVGSLFVSLLLAIRSIRKHSAFTHGHNLLRHNTATISHIQLMLGIWLYSQSAQVKAFFSHSSQAFGTPVFFAVIHIGLMLLAIVLVTIGSALAKRRQRPAEKFRTMLYWFGAALLIILIAIPWPFSPLASRPYVRGF